MNDAQKLHWKEVDSRVFSNLLPITLPIERLPGANEHFKGVTKSFPSSEHFFQMWKYAECHWAFMLRLSTGDVASYGQRRLRLKESHIKLLHTIAAEGLPIPEGPFTKGGSINVELNLPREEWDIVKLDVMYSALRVKFSDEKLKKLLLATSGCWLVEHTKNDFQWADGEGGAGTNFLGKLLMYVRAEFEDGCSYEFDREFLALPMGQLLEY